MRHWLRLSRPLLAGLLALLPVAAPAALFSDTEFDPANYDVVTFATGGGTTTFDYNRELSGGNPGAWMRLRISAPTQTGTAFGILLWKQAYDPDPIDPARPPIGSLDLAGDDICLDLEAPQPGQCHSTGIVVEQEGDYWVYRVALTTDLFWTHSTKHGLRAVELSNVGHCDDPSLICPNGGPMIRFKPDFSANAPPLRFGFYTARNGGLQWFHGRDNWSVRVNPACSVDADCDDTDPCTVDVCVAGACEVQDTCVVPGPSVRAEVLAQGTTGGVTTDTLDNEEKSPVTGLGDTAMAQAASTPVGASGEARSSLAGGLGAKASATLFDPGELVGATVTARHTRTFDVTGSTGPPPPIFDVDLLLLVEGALTIRSDINATTPNDIGASVAFDVFVTDGSGMPLASFQRFADLTGFSNLYIPPGYSTPVWADSFGPDSNPDPLTHTRATSYSELTTRTITLGTPSRIAVEMRLSAEAHTTPALPPWLAISNFYDTSSVQVSSPDPNVVLTEVDPALTTTTTTLPTRASLTIDEVRTGAHGRGRIKVHCTLTDPSARKGAKCALLGTADEAVTVTKQLHRRFNKSGVAKGALKLNREGRQRLLADGTLTVLVLATVTERDGPTTSLQATAILGGAP